MYLCNTFSHGAAPRAPHPRRILEMRHSVRLFFQQMESDSILLDPARPRVVPTPPEPAAEAPRGAAEHLHISPDASLVVREFLLDERDASGAAVEITDAALTPDSEARPPRPAPPRPAPRALHPAMSDVRLHPVLPRRSVLERCYERAAC